MCVYSRKEEYVTVKYYLKAILYAYCSETKFTLKCAYFGET